MFTALGRLTVRFRWPVVLVTLIGVLVGGLWGMPVFERLSQGGYEAEGSESHRAGALLAQAGLSQRADVIVLYTTGEVGGIDDPELGTRILDTLDALPREHVADVVSYWSVQREIRRAPADSVDTEDVMQAGRLLTSLSDYSGERGLAVVTLAGHEVDTLLRHYDAIQHAFEVPGANAEISAEVTGFIAMGHAMNERATRDLVIAEGIAIPVTLLLLVAIFGGLIAASLPVTIGALAILGAMGFLRLLSLFTEVNAFALNASILLGLGMAIDYSLFMVARFREELAHGRASAVSNTVVSAGRTVFFSGSLLILALSGMLLFPQPFIRSLAFGGTGAVAIALFLSLTTLPAGLALLGHRINAFKIPWRGYRLDATGPSRRYGDFARRVMRRPAVAAVPLLAVLVLATVPAWHLVLGDFTEKSLPVNEPTRTVAETLNADFGGIANDGALIALQGEDLGDQAVQAFATRIGTLEPIASVAVTGSNQDVTALRAMIDATRGSTEEAGVIAAIRALDPPDGSRVLVGGSAARAVDTVAATWATLPWMLLVIVTATLVMLFFAFGSIVLPLKAVAMSLLSLGASLGIVTLIFQYGFGAQLMGVTPAPLDVGVLIVIIAVLFGLSTDYEVFIVSRITEARRRGMSNTDAIAHGIAHTGRIVTTAALLLMIVIGAFALSAVPMMRILAVGMVIALILDATVIRLILVPALIKLMGEANWWVPRSLHKLLTRQ